VGYEEFRFSAPACVTWGGIEVCHASEDRQLYLPAMPAKGMPAKGSLEEGGGGGGFGCSRDSSESSESCESAHTSAYVSQHTSAYVESSESCARAKQLYLPAEALLEGGGGEGGGGCSASSERSESERRGAGAAEEVRAFFDLIDAAENGGAAAENCGAVAGNCGAAAEEEEERLLSAAAELQEQLVRSERARVSTLSY
jgi:hypothetical protein